MLANDGDLDGDVLYAFVVSLPSHGTLSLETDGSFEYVPDVNFVRHGHVHLPGQRRLAGLGRGGRDDHRQRGQRRPGRGRRRLLGQ